MISAKGTLRASKLGGTNMFNVRYIENDHTCSNNIIFRDHGQATNLIVGEFIMYKYMSTKATYTPTEIINDMINTYEMLMSYEKAQKSKGEKTLELGR